MLTSVVPSACNFSPVSQSETRYLLERKTLENQCQAVDCGTNFCQRSSISTFGFLPEPQNIRRAWINFVKTSRNKNGSYAQLTCIQV